MSLPEVLRCPRTATPLARLRVGGLDTDVCEDCGGVWLDHSELGRLDRPDTVFGDAVVAHLRQFPPEVVDYSQRLRCPRHPAVTMLRRPYSATIAVEIDVCPECGGVWLDTDELAAIRERRADAAP